MLKPILFVVAIISFRNLSLISTLHAQSFDYSHYVNPFIGTGGHGHTFPGAVMPFGMVQLSPDTRIDGSWDGCSGYHYSDSIVYGFSHTHLSGTGISDYGDILLMPFSGKKYQAWQRDSFKWNDDSWSSHFSHRHETASAGYYSVHLDDENIGVELTVTERTGFHKYVFPEGKEAFVLLDLKHRDKVLESSFHIIDRYRIEGMRRSEGWAKNQVVYFYLEFSKPFTDSYHGYLEKRSYQRYEYSGDDLRTWFQFDSTDKKPLYIKVGISQTSSEGARTNLETELPHLDFEKVKHDAAAAWNKELSKIEVNGGTDEQKRIFYTALYHCMIHPSLANDVDGKYLGRDFQVHQLPPKQNYYTVFSLWDTYRALHPLLTIIDSARTVDFIRTFLLQYEQGGRLPVWELSSNETDCMIGYHSVSVIADAATKGIKGYDYQLALQAMKHSANLDHFGLKYYKERGYISMEDEGESVSKTLEYAYDDCCIAQMAKLIADTSSYIQFMRRSQNWRNIFDWERGFMRPKKNGGWYSPFDPFEVNFNYTEANAWQYNFTVPQNIDGLMASMGSNEGFEIKLDSLFSVSSKTSGREQADITGLIGQYAHGNEPSHHMAYLYNYIGKPWKTQELVRRIMNDFYHDAPDGLIGNEDCGQMSAWYVMSAIGFYQVTPCFPYYSIGYPLFDQVKMNFGRDKILNIHISNSSKGYNYLHKMFIDGREFQLDKILSHDLLLKAFKIVFELSEFPDKKTHESHVPTKEEADLKIATSYQSRLHSVLTVPVPVIESISSTFSDSLKISIGTSYNECTIHFTVDGSVPNLNSKKYEKPFSINTSTTIKCIGVDKGKRSSPVVTAHFHKTYKNWSITYLTSYNPQYAASGEMTLIDEESGSDNFRNGQWQGWWGDDMEVIVDLGKETSISKVGAEFLQDQRSWIFYPKSLEISFSSDGKTFQNALVVNTPSQFLIQEDSVQHIVLHADGTGVQARYVKILAHNYGFLPQWHISAGEKPWIFCDEIFIE